MSESSLQLLLHAGEVEYIIKTINAPKLRNAKFVGGCLFGLWRNSLKQPVIQFATGPGKQFNARTTLQQMFFNEYTQWCVSYIRDSHRLLHLGFWFSGTDVDKEAAKKLVFMGQHKYNVLLFIDVSDETLSGEYYLQKDNVSASSTLFEEDVLPGHCSFRLYKPLTSEMEKGAIELRQPSSDPVSENIKNLIHNLPSRIQVEEAVTNQEQWYSTDEGMQDLQLLLQYFNAAGIQAGMSRDAITHNIQFDLSGGYSLDFPVNFPKKMPVLRAPDGGKCHIPRGRVEEDVCKYVVEVVSAQIQWGREGKTVR